MDWLEYILVLWYLPVTSSWSPLRSIGLLQSCLLTFFCRFNCSISTAKLDTDSIVINFSSLMHHHHHLWRQHQKPVNSIHQKPVKAILFPRCLYLMLVLFKCLVMGQWVLFYNVFRIHSIYWRTPFAVVEVFSGDNQGYAIFLIVAVQQMFDFKLFNRATCVTYVCGSGKPMLSPEMSFWPSYCQKYNRHSSLGIPALRSPCPTYSSTVAIYIFWWGIPTFCICDILCFHLADFQCVWCIMEVRLVSVCW